jgi:hypothetical protein
MVDIAPFLDATLTDLGAAAGDEPQAIALAERLGHILSTSLRLRLLDVLGEAALEISDQLTDGHVEVRLSGRDVQLVHVPSAPQESSSPPDESETARITLRLPESVKTRIEGAAEREGISTNSWLVSAAMQALDRSGRRRAGNRITGFARS